jgi:hypothetical protein
VVKFTKEVEELKSEKHHAGLIEKSKGQCEDEIQKYAKIAKKIKNDMEDYTGTGATNVKVVRDKLMADTFTNVRKLNEQLTQYHIKLAQHKITLAEKKQKIDSLFKKMEMLKSICRTFLQNNHDIYLKHEQMLDYERGEKANIAA